MTRAYGKIPRGGSKKATAQATEIVLKIHGRHTIEQLSLEVQKAIARLQDHGVYGVERCRFQLMPLDNDAKGVILWNKNEEPVTRIEIGAPPPDPPYKP